MAGLNISEASITDTAKLEGLPARLQLAYDAWLAGKDLRTLLPARTFYRYRSQLLAHGVDLAIVRDSAPASNVVPLRVVLVGTPAQVPDWAKGTPLYFEPRAAAA
jgi:II/X family phage/plasmid replication protein